MVISHSYWKDRLDGVRSYDEAEEVVDLALAQAPRPEILEFLRELYEEFIGPDGAGGGCDGTKMRLRKIFDRARVTDEELNELGIGPEDFKSVIRHG